MKVDELSCRKIEISKEFRNLGLWPWMLLQEKNNIRTRIITTYCPNVSNSAEGAYIQQL